MEAKQSARYNNPAVSGCCILESNSCRLGWSKKGARIMEIRKATPEDVPAIVEMAKILFREEDGDMLRDEFFDFMESDKDDVFVAAEREALAGFLHMAVRHDYVEGATAYPVAYMEAIYIEPAFRKQQVARKLVETGEVWAREKGYAEIASDAELENTISQSFHQKVGFQEVNRTVSFIKKVAD